MVFAIAIVVALAGGAPAAARSAGRVAVPGAEEEPPCFRAWAVPQYIGVGWTHFVDVANGCGVPIECDVATSVDPSPTILVVVPVDDVVRVRTRYGSVTWEFLPIVSCRDAA